MSRTVLTLVLILLGLAGIAAYLALFTVSQTEQAIVLEFGNPKRDINEPGLHYKIPSSKMSIISTSASSTSTPRRKR